MKAMIRFVFVPLGRANIFAEHLCHGLTVWPNIVAVAGNPVTSGLSVVSINRIAFPELCSVATTSTPVSSSPTVAEPSVECTWFVNDYWAFRMLECWILQDAQHLLGRSSKWSPLRLLPLNLSDWPLPLSHCGFILWASVSHVSGKILYNPNSYLLTSHELSSLMNGGRKAAASLRAQVTGGDWFSIAQRKPLNPLYKHKLGSENSSPISHRGQQTESILIDRQVNFPEGPEAGERARRRMCW